MIYELLDQEPPQRDAPGAKRTRRRRRRNRLSRTCAFPTAPTSACSTTCPSRRSPARSPPSSARSGAGKSTIVALRPALLRRRIRPYRDRRAGHCRRHQILAARAHRLCLAASLPVRGHDPRQHPLRPPRRDRRGDRDGGAARQCRRLHPRKRLRLRHAGRRERRHAFRRPAPAPVDRACHRAQCADPAARRGDFGARQRIRGARAGRARHGHEGPHDDRHRASAVDRRQRRQDRRHGGRARGRAGHAPRSHLPIRPVFMHASISLQGERSLDLVADQQLEEKSA